MSDLNGGERSKAWNIYPSSTKASSSGLGTSMSAISFGFVATAILISMFLIMAIFEHLFKPTPESSSSIMQQPQRRYQVTVPTGKQGSAESVQAASSSYACDLSVLMPGHHYPTYIAQPAPLPLPCQREGVYWPSHQHHFLFN